MNPRECSLEEDHADLRKRLLKEANDPPLPCDITLAAVMSTLLDVLDAIKGSNTGFNPNNMVVKFLKKLDTKR